MAEFKLGRIRFVWKGDWATGTEYYKDDVVQLGGKVYICVIGHIASPDFFTDLNVVPSKWNLVADGQRWQGEWQTEQSYIDSDIVRYGGRLYICVQAHTSTDDAAAGLESDISNWELFAEGLDWKGEWQTGFDYKQNDFVKYGGISYVCNTPHVSAATTDLGLEDDQAKWDVFNAGFEFLNDWTQNFRYKKNDVVKYGSGLYIAKQGHTSTGSFEDDSANWDRFVEGFQFESEWSPFNLYQKGDVVRYGGNQYIAISENQEAFPSTATSEWQLFSEGLKFVGDWNEDSSQIEYRVGEVVRVGGFTYRCVKDHSNQQPPNEEFWQRLNSGFDWRGDWIDAGEYYEGDVVRFGDNSYVANSYHIAEDGVNSPDVADSSEFWSIMAVGTEQSVLTTTGDLVYYSGEAPVRLPIGREGQILRVSADNVPEWAFLDSIDDVYYVTEFGTDEPAPLYGKSVDRPWRSIRYACQQIEQGARNPDAAKLLELNRRFVQRETLEWIEDQIANDVSPFTTGFSFETVKCERDIGLIIDAVIWDITHGGNVRSRQAALEYVNNASQFYTLGQEEETVAAINYALSIMENVLNQTDPEENYQVLRGDNSTRIAEQYKDNTLIAEDGVYSDIQSLVGIVTAAITAGNSNNIPPERERHTLVKVSTGKYYEVLPIIVPRQCCVMGDELRSTRVEARSSANSALTPRSDFKYSFEALARIEEIADDVVEGVSVTPTAGNSLLQNTDWPFAETAVVGPQVQKLFRSIRRQIDEKIGTKQEADFEPAYNLATPEFGKSRDLIRENIEFIKAEVIAYIADQGTGIRYSKTKCKEDVGYIIDAVSYDLTYGGNWQSVVAGEAYYDGGTLQIDSGEKALTISTYNFLNDLVKDISTNTVVVPFQDTVEQITGVGGTTTSTNRIDSLFTDIVDIIDQGTGTVSITYPTVSDADATTVINAFDSAKSQIEDDSIAFVNANFPDLTYDTAKCERDVGLIIDAAKYDLGLSTNFASIVAAYAYLRRAGEKVLNEQKDASIANFEFLRQRLRAEIPEDAQYDIANASYDNISLSVGIFDSNPTGVKFNQEGTKMFVIGLETNTIYQYNLPIPFDVTTAFVGPSLDISTEDGFATDLAFSPDGTKLFIVGDGTDSVHQYSLTTGFDLSTASYDSVSKDVSTEENRLQAVEFSTDGTKMFVVGRDSQSVYQYSLITGFDVSTATYDNISYDATSEESNLTGINFNSDGTKMFLIGLVSNSVHQYSLASSFDLSSVTDDDISFDLTTEEGSPTGFTFSTDGTKMFVVGDEDKSVLSYTTGEGPYDFARTSVDETFEWLDDIVFSGTAEGNNHQTDDQEIYNAITQLELNKEFIVEEAIAWVDEYFKDTVTGIDTGANTLTISSTEWMDLYMPVVFTDDSTDVTDAGLSEDITYYVYDIVSATEFKLSTEIGGSELDLTTAWDGSFTVQKAYVYDRDTCARDIREYIDAVKWDMTWPADWERSYTGTAGVSDFAVYRPASYKNRLAARYYANSVVGSHEEDMYYLRNATGLRLHTVAGLQGDLGPANEFGTRRPTAGAYASLDPGWGPADERVWITARSPYVQNLTTFGFAAVGQKIDGALHNGGNDSIVSNDFTQVISDGIGAWITNNGRAELVSVFTYYAHVGYLAETGGRIRATNGNNSYGTFGSVAEGVDPEETPVTAVVDNRTQFNATINNVYTDGDQILTTEFGHAGNNYTEAQIDFFGAGANEEGVADEFRDGAVFQVRIDEENDGEAGGDGYVVVSNTAQSGSLTGIFLAATDGRASSAYPGMKIYIVGGAGRGQYGIIDTYLAGTKEATVVKEDGTAGWEHVVPGTTIVAPNATSVYEIEPRIEFSAPPVSSSAITVPSDEYVAIEYAETSAVYTAVSPSGGTGSGATFDVTRNGSKYYLAINSAGSGYARLDELVIAGTDVGGASPLNDITVLILSLDASGSITEFEIDGTAQKGIFFALPATGQTGYTSVDGSSWSTTTMASSETWSDVASGLLDDGSSLFKPDVIVAVSQDGSANYSTDGAQSWSSSLTGLPTSGNKRIAFGNVGVDNNRFVVISDNSQDVAFTQDGGANWTVTSNALPATGFDILAYGKGLFVALSGSSRDVAYSEDGVTWTVETNALPDIGTYVDLAWGNGRFVALQIGGNTAISLDGINWQEGRGSSPRSSNKIAYGQGVFVITSVTASSLSYSEDGINWTLETGLPTTYTNIAFGNPNQTGRFIALEAGTTTAGIDFRAGAKARGRAGVSNEQIFEVRMLEPGSGYTSAPTVTVTDPNNTDDVLLVPRIGNGALANPTYISRGEGYTEATAELNPEGSNGEANFFQAVDQIAVKRLSSRPVDGSNVVFDSIPGKFFKLVSTVSFVGDADGSYTAFLRISPALTINEAPADEDPVTLRIRYSQVRLTGHDFLDIGTGNFNSTNYPNEPNQLPDQTNETVDSDGGRVFFTATDQDGNFRVGDLFSVEQSTGVASINADAFNLAGLQELTLGEVTLGGNSASINEFSTDPFFTANSDAVVPTQRAVKAYIEAQIGGGGASLNVNSVTAGDIFVGGNQITTVSGDPINIQANVVYRGAVLGIPLAYQYFLR